jgi:hypothetical protein
MKLTETTLTLALIAFGTASFAGIIPAHEPNGFRDTGCDEASRVEIRNDAGELLYVNNVTCPDAGGNALIADFFAAFDAANPSVEPEDEPAAK